MRGKCGDSRGLRLDRGQVGIYQSLTEARLVA